MKKLSISLLAAGLLAFGSVQAATINLINGGAPQDMGTLGSTLVNPTSGLFDINYSFGGLVTFKLVAPTNPVNSMVHYVLKNLGDVVVQDFYLDNDAATSASDVFQFSQAGGSYKLNIETAARSTITEISAVPLPAAALLFASSLFGAGALRRKKQQEVAQTVAA